MDVLGISAFRGPSAACLVRDGRVIAAAREDRFTRRRGDRSFPQNSVAYCLRAGKIGPSSLRAVAFAGRPRAVPERGLQTYLETAPRGFGSLFRCHSR